MPDRHAGSHADPDPLSPAAAKSKLYNPRHPERTMLYRTVAGHLEPWLALCSAVQLRGNRVQLKLSSILS